MKYEHRKYENREDDDIQGILEFIQDADIVEGPEELYAMVAALWPNLLHKVKPPRSLMH